jgi:pimeloyl-ACP methyl ester carboxylesterase
MDVERGLFLPGASGVASFWQGVIKELSLPYECLSFDYPGYGGNPPDPRRSSLAQLADWIGSYIDRPTNLFAQSMGGAIALQLALQHHSLVRRLILTGTTGGVHLSSPAVEQARASYAASADRAAWLSNPEIPPATRVANLPMPCLVIFGSGDPIAPLEVGRAFAKGLPDATFVDIPTQSHFFVREQPELVAGHIRSFLDTKS